MAVKNFSKNEIYGPWILIGIPIIAFIVIVTILVLKGVDFILSGGHLMWTVLIIVLVVGIINYSKPDSITRHTISQPRKYWWIWLIVLVVGFILFRIVGSKAHYSKHEDYVQPSSPTATSTSYVQSTSEYANCVPYGKYTVKKGDELTVNIKESWQLTPVHANDLVWYRCENQDGNSSWEGCSRRDAEGTPYDTTTHLVGYKTTGIHRIKILQGDVEVEYKPQ
jgi:uncharacterized membrane protein YhaH (DUF805 family)